MPGRLADLFRYWPSRFIGFLSFALNYRFNEFSVLGYHLVSVLLHILASLTACWLTRMTFMTPAMKKEGISRYKGILSFFAGLIFLAHPVQTETVVYIFQRVTVLAALFYLLSLCLYIKARLDLDANGRLNVPCYAASFAAALIAMFSKENAGTIPLMILLYELCFFSRDKRVRWKYTLPFFILLPVVPITVSLSKSVVSGDVARFFENSMQNSTHYLLTQFKVMVTYIRLLVAPVNQNLLYDYPVSKSLFELPVLASIAFLGSILALAVRWYNRHRIISFGVFWFFLTLLPESTVIPLEHVIFEHRLYLPMAGFGLFLAGITYHVFKGRGLTGIVIALIVITSSFALLTYRRNRIWTDELTLWDDVIQKSSMRPHRKAAPFHYRGDAYKDSGDIERALADYNKAIEIDPGYAKAYNNRGNLYKQTGDLQRAITDYNKVIAIDPMPADAYNNRGNVYMDLGDMQKALADYNKAIELNASLTGVYANRARVHKMLGNNEQALADYNKAIELNPHRASVYNNRGNIYMLQGRFQQALADFDTAIKIDPHYAYAYYNRGYLHKKQGNHQQALTDFNKAVRLKPDIAGVYLKRGTVNKGAGNIEQALADYNKAIEINPDRADTYFGRAVVYYQMKDFDKAWADARKAESLGYQPNAHDMEFLEKLKIDSGRSR